MASSDPAALYHCVASYHNFHARRVTTLALAPDGELLASASSDGSLVVINVSNHQSILRIDFETPLFATCMLWPQARRLYVGRSDGAVQVVAVDASRRSASIVQALQTIIKLPIRRMAYDVKGRFSWLAIAFMGTVEIYRLQLDAHENPLASTWNLIDEVLTDNSDGELVTSLNFVAPSKDQVGLIITHAQSGYSYWKGVKTTERRSGTSIGNAHVTKGGRIIASTNLAVGGFDLVTIKEGKFGSSERHYELQFDEAKNYEIPIRFLFSNTVVLGSSRGVAEIVNVETEERVVLGHAGSQLINVLDSVGANFATGTGDEAGPGTIRYFKPGATAYREFTVAGGGLTDGTPRLSLAALYSDYLKKRDAARQAQAGSHAVTREAKKVEARKAQLGVTIFATLRILGTYKRTLYSSATVCALAVVIVVLADDPKDIPSPTSARWLPAFLRYHILSVFSALGDFFWNKVAGWFGQWWAAAMQRACRSTGAACDNSST